MLRCGTLTSSVQRLPLQKFQGWFVTCGLQTTTVAQSNVWTNFKDTVLNALPEGRDQGGEKAVQAAGA